MSLTSSVLKKLKALTRYEGFGNKGADIQDALSDVLKALTRYEGFGNKRVVQQIRRTRRVEGTDPL